MTKRKEVRLKSYDYSQEGFYFVTVCTENRKSILGDVVAVNESVGGDLQIAPQTTGLGDPWGYSVGMPYTKLSKSGETVLKNINYIKNTMQNFDVDCFCIMPNHIHIIIENKGGGSICKSTPTTEPKNLARLIAVFKSITSKQAGVNLWQRNYYEHVIRDDKDLLNKRRYVLENPLRWTLDEYYS